MRVPVTGRNAKERDDLLAHYYKQLAQFERINPPGVRLSAPMRVRQSVWQ